MNIFFLDEDVKKSAEYHCDKHICKMILEYAQLLSTAHRILDNNESSVLYKSTHVNHLCGKWVRESLGNYSYVYSLFVAVSQEYTFRYGKDHLSYLKLKDVLKSVPNNINKSTLDIKTAPLCMPDEFKKDDVVGSYRNYYINGKSKSFSLTWKNRDVPYWFI